MDENNYRSTYREINELPCAFEKALLQQCCQCHLARHFNLAERIGVACTVKVAHEQCREFLAIMHEKSVFALHFPLPETGKLPHAKEIKIQCGSVNGLLALARPDENNKDVNVLLVKTTTRFSGLDKLPYEQIVRDVASFEGRKRRPRK